MYFRLNAACYNKINDINDLFAVFVCVIMKIDRIRSLNCEQGTKALIEGFFLFKRVAHLFSGS